MIKCTNCVEGMEELPDDHIDLTVTSPPFDNMRDYNGYEFDYQKVIKQLHRITKPGGIVVWVVADASINGGETLNSFRHALCFQDCGFICHDTMIYKRNAVSAPSKVRYYSCFQYMFVMSKGKPKTINLIADHANKTAGKKARVKKQREEDGSFRIKPHYEEQGRKGRPETSIRWNVWTYDVGSLLMAEDRLWSAHPAVFPLKLAEDHIVSWSNEGDLVFDPMMGSGQTLIAAKKLKRKYLGMDISEEYCQLAEKRLELY